MDILPFNFYTCKICGMWYNDHNFFVLKTIYRISVLFIIFQFTLSQVFELVTMQGSLDELTEVLFLTLTFVALCLKIFNFVNRQREMCDLLDSFRSSVCRSMSPHEEEISRRCSNTAKKIFVSIMGLSQSTGLVLLIIPFLSSASTEIPLPFKTYQPYNVSNSFNFWITYVLQVFAAVYGVLLNVALDTMVYGFLIMATAQYEINCYRLKNSLTSIKDCIEHHVLIHEIVYKIQCFFIRVILPLFIFSLITLCTSIFQMSQV